MPTKEDEVEEGVLKPKITNDDRMVWKSPKLANIIYEQPLLYRLSITECDAVKGGRSGGDAGRSD